MSTCVSAPNPILPVLVDLHIDVAAHHAVHHAFYLPKEVVEGIVADWSLVAYLRG